MTGHAGVAQLGRALKPAGDTSWMRAADCRGRDPEWWFTNHPGLAAEAKRICAGCPVKERCEEHAAGEKAGIWAAKRYGSVTRRKKVRRCPVCHRTVKQFMDGIAWHRDSARIAKCPGTALPYDLTEEVTAA